MLAVPMMATCSTVMQRDARCPAKCKCWQREQRNGAGLQNTCRQLGRCPLRHDFKGSCPSFLLPLVGKFLSLRGLLRHRNNPC